MRKEPLKFKVAPHIVQDLGLNLYTTLPRVLVEFIANAYDADSPFAKVTLDYDRIHAARDAVKARWEAERDAMPEGQDPNQGDDIVSLGERVLPDDIQICIEDNGHGMTRKDLQEKFLVAGRRRREEEHSSVSTNGRQLMGRKGLGKLAGFGIARLITIVTKTASDAKAIEVVLDFDKLLENKDIHEITIPDTVLGDDGGLGDSGTRVVLSRLVYEPMRSRLPTIANAIGNHFVYIDREDFDIKLNGSQVNPTSRVLAFAWPEPEQALDKLVEHRYSTEDGRTISFKYRIRFTGPGHHLDAKERGVRVYAHKRLAAAAHLLDVKTGMHGFRNTEYLDGVVHADFIDEEESTDYIATDRQTLRWDSYLLAPMREFLTKEMKTACNEYQKKKDAEAVKEIREDAFTKGLIEEQGLPKHRKELAYRVASLLAPVCQDGKEGDEYKQRLPIFVDGLGQGDILSALSKLAGEERPEMGQLIAQVAELTAREFGDFARYVQGRLDGIQGLKNLYENVDFKKANNEAELHELFNKCPWLIDPTFTQFLTSNQSENEVNKRLSRELKIGPYVPESYDKHSDDETEQFGSNKRPDLVFLLSSESLMRLVVVELKAPNTPLHLDHLTQLKGYLGRTQKWLVSQGGYKSRYTVEGYLIGSKASPDCRQELVDSLEYEIEKRPPSAEWAVFDIGEVLDRTKLAHEEILRIYQCASEM